MDLLDELYNHIDRIQEIGSKEIDAFKEEFAEELIENLNGELELCIANIQSFEEHKKEIESEIRKKQEKIFNFSEYEFDLLGIEILDKKNELLGYDDIIDRERYEINHYNNIISYLKGEISALELDNRGKINLKNWEELKKFNFEKIISNQMRVIELSKDVLTEMKDASPLERDNVRYILFENMKYVQEKIDDLDDGMEKEEKQEEYNKLTKFKPNYIKNLEKFAKIEDEISDCVDKRKRLTNQQKELREKLDICPDEEKEEIICILRRINYELEVIRSDIQIKENEKELESLYMDRNDNYISDDEFVNKRDKMISRNRNFKDDIDITLAREEIPILKDEQSIIMKKIEKGLISETEANEKLEEISRQIKMNLSFLPEEPQDSIAQEEINIKNK